MKKRFYENACPSTEGTSTEPYNGEHIHHLDHFNELSGEYVLH
jgi:hypothetical protein